MLSPLLPLRILTAIACGISLLLAIPILLLPLMDRRHPFDQGLLASSYLLLLFLAFLPWLLQLPPRLRRLRTSDPPALVLILSTNLSLWLLAAMWLAFLLLSSGQSRTDATTASTITVGVLLLAGGVLLLIGAALSLQLLKSLQRRHGQLVLDYLDHALRLNLPLPPMLISAGQSERGALGWRLTHLGRQVAEGHPLETALAQSVPELEERTLRLIGVAERMGHLGPTLTWLAADHRHREAVRAGRPRLHGVYFFSVLGALGVFFLLVSLLIFPKFPEIFADFDVQPSWLTAQAMTLGHWMIGPAFGLRWFLLGIGGLTLIQTLSRNRNWRLRLQAALHTLPGLGRRLRERQWGEVCFVLARGAEGGLPLPAAARDACDLQLSRRIRRAVWAWACLLEEGHSPAAAAREAHWPPLITRLLPATELAANPEKAFDFLARYYHLRFSRLVIFLQGILGPLTMMLLGLLVAALAYALFSPLVELIWEGIRHVEEI